jgi:hypothetical protein
MMRCLQSSSLVAAWQGAIAGYYEEDKEDSPRKLVAEHSASTEELGIKTRPHQEE